MALAGTKKPLRVLCPQTKKKNSGNFKSPSHMGTQTLPFGIKAITSDFGSEDTCSIQVTATKTERVR